MLKAENTCAEGRDMVMTTVHKANANRVYSLSIPRHFSRCLMLWPHQGVANPAVKSKETMTSEQDFFSTRESRGQTTLIVCGSVQSAYSTDEGFRPYSDS